MWQHQPVLPNTCLASCSQFSSVQLLSHVWLFATPWTAARQVSLSITNSRSLLKLMSIESVMPSNHLILCHPLLLPSIFPSIRVFSNESVLHIRKQCDSLLGCIYRNTFVLSCVWLFAAPWTEACQLPLFMGFPMQEDWRGLPFPSPGDLPNPEIEPASRTSPALAGSFFTTFATWKASYWAV